MTGPRAIALRGDRPLTAGGVVAVDRERRADSLGERAGARVADAIRGGRFRPHALAAGAGRAPLTAGRA